MSFLDDVRDAVEDAGAAGLIAGVTSFLAPGSGAFLTPFLKTFTVSAVTGAVARALADDPERASQDVATTVRSSTFPRRYVYGRHRIGGLLTNLETNDDEDELLLLLTLCDGPIEEVEEIYFDDQFVGYYDGATFQIEDDFKDSNGNPVVEIGAYLNGHVTPQVSDKSVDDFSNMNSTDHPMHNLAYLVVNLKFNPDIFGSGLPKITALIKGRNSIYDPRDATGKYTTNPALCIRDYLRDDLIGMGVPASDLNDESFKTAADECEEFILNDGNTETIYDAGTISVTNGGTTITGYRTKWTEELLDNATLTQVDGNSYSIGVQLDPGQLGTTPQTAEIPLGTWGGPTVDKVSYEMEITGSQRYRLDGVVSSKPPPRDNLEKMLTSMAGWLTFSAGVWNIKAGSFTSSVKSLDESNLISSISVTTKSSRRDKFNSIKGTFMDEGENFIKNEFAPIENSAFKAEDGGDTYWGDISLPFTIREEHAQRLAKIELQRNRREVVVEAVFDITCLELQAGDTVSLSNDRFGWSNKTFEVTDLKVVSEEGNLGVAMTLRETDSAVYDFNQGDIVTPPASEESTLPDPHKVKTPTGVSTELVKETNEKGQVVQYIKVTWNESTSPAVDYYTVRWNNEGTAEEFQYASVAGTEYTIYNVAPNSTYEIGVRATNNIGALSAWNSVTGVATDDVYPEIPKPSGLELEEGGNTTEFTGKEAKFAWRDVSNTLWYELGSEPEGQGADAGAKDPFFFFYEVKLYDDSDNLLRFEWITENRYVYTFEKNAEDYKRINGAKGANRSFRIEVRTVSRQNQVSEPAKLSVSNPAPELPNNLSVSAAFQSIDVTYTRPDDLDFEGVLVYLGTSSGFTRDSNSLQYDGPDNNIRLGGLTTGTTYYIRLSPYDAFGKTGLNESSEFTVTTQAITNPDVDTTAPTTPANLTLTTGVEESKLSVRSWVKGDWDASTDDGLVSGYEVQWWTSGDTTPNATFTADTEFRFWDAVPGETYNFRVRAVDWASNKSSWTSTDTIVADGDTSDPGQPTGISVTPGLRKLVIKWTPPSADNYLQTRVYVGTTSGFTAGASTLEYEGRGDTFVFEDTSASTSETYYVKLTAVSASGVESSITAESGPHSVTVISDADVDQFFQSAAITNAIIKNLDAAKITTGTLDANRIGADTITASKIDVNTLDAISADFGEMTSGTVTGALIRTSSSNPRVELSSTDGVRGFNSGGTGTFQLDTDGSGFVGTGSTALSWDTNGNVTAPGDISTGFFDSSLITTADKDGTDWRVEMGPRVDGGTTYVLRYWNGTDTRFSVDSVGNMLATGDFQTAESGQRFVLDSSANEAYFYTDWDSDGTAEQVLSLGFSTAVGANEAIIKAGSSSFNRYCIYAQAAGPVATIRADNDGSSCFEGLNQDGPVFWGQADNNFGPVGYFENDLPGNASGSSREDGAAIYGVSLANNAVVGYGINGIFGETNTAGAGVRGETDIDSAASLGVIGIATNGTSSIGVQAQHDDGGTALFAVSTSAGGIGMIASGDDYGIKVNTLSNKGPLRLKPDSASSAPSHTAEAGTLWLTSDCVLYVNTDGGTTWEKVGAQ